jgi:1-acyl-sn-glycerol-3-phosphate acyltransferase
VRDRVYRLIVALGGGLFRLLALRRTVRGAENVPLEGGVVLAISHFSYLDFALAEWALWRSRRRYTRFMATAASFRHPVAGPLMRSMGHIPVERGDGTRGYELAVQALERGEVVGLFPETRVSGTFTLLPFKTGAIRMAAAAGVPLVPCVVWGSHRVLTKGRPFSLREAWRSPVSIVFGEPVLVTHGADPAEATEELREVMAGMLAEAQHDYLDGGPAGAWWVPAHLGGGAPAEESRLAG